MGEITLPYKFWNPVEFYTQRKKGIVTSTFEFELVLKGNPDNDLYYTTNWNDAIYRKCTIILPMHSLHNHINLQYNNVGVPHN